MIEAIRKHYDSLPAKVAAGRKKLGRPLTYAEKILWSHLHDAGSVEWQRGMSFLLLKPDRVAMQDATAQMALLQFMTSGKKTAAVPSTVHCDHLILAQDGAKADLSVAEKVNREVYDFLSSVCSKYGIGFWKPGSGIIHQVVLENYAFPGGLMIGTDSHTPNAGGLGMFASGVGGADAVDVMADFPWEVKLPKVIGVHLKGKLSGWASPKDVILKLCGLLTTKGGTNAVIEYFGAGVESLSCTGKGTICNMGAELGATTSVFPWDNRMADYLRATNRSDVADLAVKAAAELKADPEVLADPKQYYDQVVEIDLSTLEPQLVGPHTPDRLHSIGTFSETVRQEKFPNELSACLIGSCTNSSYEDIGRSVHILKQALAKGAKVRTKFFVSPGSDRIYETIKRDGMLEILEQAGATVLSNSCGPCIGQWSRPSVKAGTVNSIVSSFNRNFRARNDSNPETLSFLASPETVTAMALSGRLDVDFTRQSITTDKGDIRLSAPVADDLPQKGFAETREGYAKPAADGSKITVAVDPKSDRLQLLEPFSKWDGKDCVDLPLLLKAKGKCTTDHISAAGPWLKYRGHLDNISDNMFLGAVNAFTGEAGTGKNVLTGETGKFPALARHYKKQGLGWVAVGDENYGEGSSREHAAMSPRFLGCRAVITRSFARIHETNLKKQGILPLTFSNPADYDKVREGDRVSLLGLSSLAPGKPITCRLKHADGQAEEILLAHTYNAEQIGWFKAGSALNLIRS
ncbi:MAG: aconitate hydratase [Planctomycetota bacterium]